MGSCIHIIMLVALSMSCSLIEARARDNSRSRASCPSTNQCRKQCEYGFMVNDNNCTICACKSNPSAIDCPAIECPNYCSSYQADKDGCTTCECKANSNIQNSRQSISQTCSDAMCLMYCKYDFKSDQNGCPICECRTKEEACGTRRSCKLHCPHGFKEDEKGCDICECQSPPSSSSSSRRSSSQGSRKSGSSGSSRHNCGEIATCLMHCSNGFKRDENGCEICECAEAAVQSTRILESSSRGRIRHDHGQDDSRSGTKVRCQRRKCPRRCLHGYVKDSFGCNTCACSSRRSKPTSPPCPVCSNYCPFGRKRINDGCESCTCNDPPAADPKNCITCRMHCEHGFKEKADGCFECECKDAPSSPLCISCTMYCEHGFKKGSDGCDLCQCNSAPQ